MSPICPEIGVVFVVCRVRCDLRRVTSSALSGRVAPSGTRSTGSRMASRSRRSWGWRGRDGGGPRLATSRSGSRKNGRGPTYGRFRSHPPDRTGRCPATVLRDAIPPPARRERFSTLDNQYRPGGLCAADPQTEGEAEPSPARGRTAGYASDPRPHSAFVLARVCGDVCV